jgi:hypothetical protein
VVVVLQVTNVVVVLHVTNVVVVLQVTNVVVVLQVKNVVVVCLFVCTVYCVCHEVPIFGAFLVLGHFAFILILHVY